MRKSRAQYKRSRQGYRHGRKKLRGRKTKRNTTISKYGSSRGGIRL